MKFYRIKHIPTGGYYIKDRFHYSLSSKGKVYKIKQKVGNIIVTVSKSSPYYVNNPNLNWYQNSIHKDKVNLTTYASEWVAEELNSNGVSNDVLKELAERAAMADMYEHFFNTDDQGALFMDECIYESDPNTDNDIRLKEEYREYFEEAYKEYLIKLNIN